MDAARQSAEDAPPPVELYLIPDEAYDLDDQPTGDKLRQNIRRQWEAQVIGQRIQALVHSGREVV